MTFLSKFEKVLAFVERIGGYISGLSVIVMMFMVTGDVLLRNIARIQVLGVYELCQYVMMPLIVLPGIGYVYHSKVLPKFDLLPGNRQSKGAKFMYLSVSVIEIIVFGMLAWYSIVTFTTSMGKSVLIDGKIFPLGWVYLMCPIGFGTMFLDSIIEGIKRLVAVKEAFTA